MRVFAIIAALVAVGLAGCAGDSGSNDTGLSAAEGMEAESLAWHPSAELVNLGAIELRSDSPFLAGFSPDPAIGAEFSTVLKEPVGDGRSNVWIGVYKAGSEVITMFWTPDRVIFQNATDDFGFGAPINTSKVVVDSDEAADILAEADANWTTMRESVDVIGSVNLMAMGDNLYWTFFAGNVDFSGEFITGAVDAVTGNVTTDFSVEPESISGSISGLGGLLGTPSGSTTFELERNHESLEVFFDQSGGDPLISLGLDVTVTDPDGQTYSFDVTTAGSFQSFPGVAGTWTVAASSSDLVLATSLSFSGATIN